MEFKYSRTSSGIELSREKDGILLFICTYRDGPRDYHTKQSKSEKEKNHTHHLCVDSKYDTNKPMCKKKQTQTQRAVLWSTREEQ